MEATALLASSQGSTRGRLEKTLEVFGFRKLSDEQRTLIGSSVGGKDVLGILPTGGGKSACFQIPGIVTGARTLVISPLIALQEDQIAALREIGVRAFALHSNLEPAKKAAIKWYFRHSGRNEPSFLYLSPELLLQDSFHEIYDSVGFTRVAVDEAHCVSTWGTTFRPDYLRIRVAVERMGIQVCSAFTATVDPKIERDIRKYIPLKSDFVKVVANPMRPNLELRKESVPPITSTMKRGQWKYARVSNILEDPELQGPAIVYFNSRASSADVYLKATKDPWMSLRGYKPHLFHAELPFDDKDKALQGFRHDEKPIVFATSAFGMGINRADVRHIIHYNTPTRLIEYAQQIGRGGRDGEPALCTVFYSSEDSSPESISRKAHTNAPTFQFVERVHANLHRAIFRCDPVERSRYNVRTFLAKMERMVNTNDAIEAKERYLHSIMASVAILQEARVIQEDGGKLVLYPIGDDTPQHARLIEQTKMHERMLAREMERVVEFFGKPELDQHLLWEILKKK